MNLCTVRQCWMSKILQRRKSRACFMSCLMLLGKHVIFANWKTHTFDMCVYFGASFFFSQKIKFFVLFHYIELGHGYLLEERNVCVERMGQLEWQDYCEQQHIASSSSFAIFQISNDGYNKMDMHFHTKKCIFSYLMIKMCLKNVSFCIQKQLGCTNIHGLKP